MALVYFHENLMRVNQDFIVQVTPLRYLASFMNLASFLSLVPGAFDCPFVAHSRGLIAIEGLACSLVDYRGVFIANSQLTVLN